MKSKNTSANPWAAMDKLMEKQREPVGLDWFTVEQYANRYDMSRAGSHQRLTEMTKSGVLERWIGIGGPHKRCLSKYRLKQ